MVSGWLAFTKNADPVMIHSDTLGSFEKKNGKTVIQLMTGDIKEVDEDIFEVMYLVDRAYESCGEAYENWKERIEYKAQQKVNPSEAKWKTDK